MTILSKQEKRISQHLGYLFKARLFMAICLNLGSPCNDQISKKAGIAYASTQRTRDSAA